MKQHIALEAQRLQIHQQGIIVESAFGVGPHISEDNNLLIKRMT